jgi:signal transduction histidine kinase
MDIRPRILIIDDEEVVLDACVQILGERDYVLSTAADGAAGLDRLGTFHPDLVFVDLKMPGLSGFQVLERIREIDPAVVTVVITGYATLSSAVEAMQKGAYDFLPKPFTPDEFRVVTTRALEKRRLQQEALRLRRERDLLREQFASIISHELKAPLAVVQQHLMLLAHDLSAVLSEGQQQRLERLQGRVADLLGLISTWVRAISTDMEHLRASFGPVDLRVVAGKALDSVGLLATRKGITVETSLPQTLPLVSGDSGTLVEALVNLLGNAVKYSHPEGRVILALSGADRWVTISVQDFGVGIPPDELPLISGGLYRGAAGTAGERGSGLGLAVTRRIVEAHGGTLAIESMLGAGSTFTITLPAAAAEAAA